MDALYLQIETLEKDLANDEQALHWFNLTPAPSTLATPPPTEFALPGTAILFKLILELKIIL